MKKVFLFSFLVSTLFVISCGSDDDGGKGNCRTCANGPVSVDICDNGDGTYSVNGDSDKIPIPSDSNFEAVVQQSCEIIGAK